MKLFKDKKSCLNLEALVKDAQVIDLSLYPKCFVGFPKTLRLNLIDLDSENYPLEIKSLDVPVAGDNLMGEPSVAESLKDSRISYQKVSENGRETLHMLCFKSGRLLGFNYSFYFN